VNQKRHSTFGNIYCYDQLWIRSRYPPKQTNILYITTLSSWIQRYTESCHIIVTCFEFSWPWTQILCKYMDTIWSAIKYKQVFLWVNPRPFWYTVFRVFRRYATTQMVGTQYAKKSVISYAGNYFYFKKVQFSSRKTTNVTYKVK